MQCKQDSKKEAILNAVLSLVLTGIVNVVCLLLIEDKLIAGIVMTLSSTALIVIKNYVVRRCFNQRTMNKINNDNK